MHIAPTGDPSELLRLANQALMQHLPSSESWLVATIFGGAALLGLVLMTHGARLAVVMSALVLAVASGAGGGALATSFGLPLWPTVGVAALAGGVAAVVLFRVMLAGSMGVCIALAGLTAYATTTLLPHLSTYTSTGLEAGVVSLPDSAAASGWAELGAIWAHLAAKVPALQISLAAIVLVGALAGLVVGWLLPWAARSVWGATLGTLLFLVAGIALLEQFFPAATEWLRSLGPWGWSIVAALWVSSLLYNLLSGKRRTVLTIAEPAPAPTTA